MTDHEATFAVSGAAMRHNLTRASSTNTAEVTGAKDGDAGSSPAEAHPPFVSKAPCGCKWYADSTYYKCLTHRFPVVANGAQGDSGR